MAGAKLSQELAESKTELDKLWEQISNGMHTVHKDLSLVSLVPNGRVRGTPTHLKKVCQTLTRRQ